MHQRREEGWGWGTHLRLRHQEPSKDEHGGAEAGEGDESAVAAAAHGDEHVGDGARDDEVEEPLGGGGEGDVEGAQARRRDLRHVDPADLRVHSCCFSGVSWTHKLQHVM